MLDAAISVVDDLRRWWPITLLRVHYALAMLEEPPLLNVDRKKSRRYGNTRNDYDNLSDLLTRARAEGYILWEAIGDETRPVATWQTWQDPRAFIRQHLDGLFQGYWRDLMQSQPNHIEVWVEKNTVYQIAKDVGMRYCILTGAGRGYAAATVQRDIVERFEASGKERLIVLFATDLDPEGVDLVKSTGRNFVRDHGIAESRFDLIRVALTPENIERYGITQFIDPKPESSRYGGYVEEHGTRAWTDLDFDRATGIDQPASRGKMRASRERHVVALGAGQHKKSPANAELLC